MRYRPARGLLALAITAPEQFCDAAQNAHKLLG
jgi:hypothetical protein